MYFDTSMKKQAIEVVCDALRPGGILIIGDVDPVRTTAELTAAMPCTYQRPGVYQKPGGAAPMLSEMTKVSV
jgi:chemotaxis methyl-accepting protein methylase